VGPCRLDYWFFTHDEFYRTSQKVYSSVMNLKEHHNIMGRFVVNLIKRNKIMGLIFNDTDSVTKILRSSHIVHVYDVF
jgi:hypothetical protein